MIPAEALQVQEGAVTNVNVGNNNEGQTGNGGEQGVPPPPSMPTEQSSAIAIAVAAATTPITAAAKSALFKHFKDQDWKMNILLPKGNAFPGNIQLAEIVNKFNLKRDQVARQLRNYKNEVLGHTQVNILLGTDDLRQRVRDNLTFTSLEFVSETLKRICHLQPAYGSDFNNYCSTIDCFPSITKTYIGMLAGSPTNSCVALLVSLVDFWIDEMAEIFPKTSAGIPNAQIDFEKRKDANMHTFIDTFMDKEYESSGIYKDISKKSFGDLGAFLHVVLFMSWSHSVCKFEKPPVEFPTDCLVGKYARPVIYYVAGWTLYKASKALTIAKDKRSIYFDFARMQSISEDDAHDMGLPTHLVDRRKRGRGSSMYCTQQYFDFICFVESVYLANLTLKMLTAYSDGDIIAVIKNSIISNDSALDKFAILFNGEMVKEEDRRSLIEYVVGKYANMRGAYFAKHLKGNSGNFVTSFIENQATRTKVANAFHLSKVVASKCGDAAAAPVAAVDETKSNDDDDGEFECDATPEHQLLWQSAAESVLENADKGEEQDEDSDDNE